MLLNSRKLATLQSALPILSSSFTPISRNHSNPHHNPSQNPIEPLTQQELKTLVLKQCSHGRFFNLMENVISSPSVLLTACQNLKTPATTSAPNSRSLSLLDSVSSRFSLEELGQQIRDNQLDIEACCVRVPPSSKNGEALAVPNLKLKSAIEAVRMVLEIIYDDRFVTFSYGGRVNMGRHTAIRYLKNSVGNPQWWFNVSFIREFFVVKHVCKLCSIIEEKIEDRVLIDFIKRLFECEAVRIELGGCYLGRGFPQENSLSSILINIYFNAFDKDMQAIRLQTDQANPKFDLKEKSGSPSNVFYKPVMVHVVRYLDEILIITSGSKMLTLDLKDWVLKFLEGKLELKVDRLRTAIHSAVSEKVGFLGMELQAVPPSVLHPPMSEKAVRARKKYLRQKEVQAIELRNARETNRKKLGLKILSHVFKKSKKSNGFKFEFQIENEVREIFRVWADEVVQEFLGSLEDRWTWHRMLSAGDFLSLRHIRDQLPQELVDAYDNFQEQVDAHLKPTNARKILEKNQKRAEEEEQQRYSDRTVQDLTRLCIKVTAPRELVQKAVKMAGFTNNLGRPRPIDHLIVLKDADIIKWYAGIGRRWLDFFCCCWNFKMVKTIVTYHLRFSCLLTLSKKHESTKKEVIRHYTKDLKLFDCDGGEQVHYPTEREIKMMGDKNLSDPKPVDGAFSLGLIRWVTDEISYSCLAHFCDRKDIVVYRIRLLQKQLNVNPLNEKKWIAGMGAIHESFSHKCLPLCPDHISDLYLGKITFQDIDCSSLLNVD